MRSRRRSSLVAFLAASLVAGCGDGIIDPMFAPGGGLVTRYALVEANGQALPVTLHRESSGASAALVADTLALDALGGAQRRRVLRFTDAAGATRDEAGRLELEYQRRGMAIEVGWLRPCPPNAMCIGNDVGTLVPGRLFLESHFYVIGNRPASLVYRKLPSPP